MTVPVEVARLIETFERNIESYRQGRYNEAQVRKEFIDPFFKALGWDVDNTKGWAEAYKDVIHEDAIRVGGATKAPDYCFRIGGTRKFFLEAKKPSVNIKDAPDPAYQLRRYAWSAKLPLSILTDFEEFAVYDCRVQPNRTDKPSKARILYYTYDQYAEKWDEIASRFSRDAVLKGSFDKYAVSEKRKRGTAEVDAAFLAEIERWRDMLARNIALRNPNLTNRQLNYAVQITIDRIIFLRICEDRGIEPYGQLQGFVGGTEVYARLVALFRRADDRYNSGLFHFMREKDRTQGPDELTPELIVDDKPLKDILRSLYYPDSPYEFSVLPPEILGQVYEQFLGKVITLTAGHHAKVEDKPEVKKAGGVYYTPSYIVDYIVEHTVGKLLEDRRVEVAEISRGRGKRRLQTPSMNPPLRVLDPACGSGSFLLGAYQKLLEWYRDHYAKNDPQTWAKMEEPPIACAADGSWKLTTAERKRILLEHIYGVDIDPQAVEVTKLSLLLRVLEGEKNLVLFHNERALPDLADNIKCGNSLIGPDFYQGQQTTMFDEDERLRINAFDWHAEFPHVFKDGGFDAVIGNPPYGASLSEDQVLHLRKAYAAQTADTYALFIEKGAALLRSSGMFGMIVQSGWVSAPGSSALRQLFLRAFKPVTFASMPYDVFGAYVDTVVVVAERLPNDKTLGSFMSAPTILVVFPPKAKVASLADFELYSKQADACKWLDSSHDELLITLSDAERGVISKLRQTAYVLADAADIQRGVTPFSLSEVPVRRNSREAFNGTVRRYTITMGAKAYIQYDESLAEYKAPRYFQGPRLLLRELISRQFRLQAVYTHEDFITNKSMQSILPVSEGPHILYLLALLNSRLLSWFFLAVHSVGRRDDFPKIVLKQTRELPLPDFNPTIYRDHHDRMVGLVEGMLSLHKSLSSAKTADERNALQRQIDATDKEIDRLVYELYGLSNDEIRIVEGATRTA
jgi:predicted type IV restriction endonuclease